MKQWKNYLARRGQSIEGWLDAHGVASIDDLRARARKLDLLLLPGDEDAVREVLKAKAKAARAKVVQPKPKVAEEVVPVKEQDPVSESEPAAEEAPKPRRKRKSKVSKQTTTTEEN